MTARHSLRSIQTTGATIGEGPAWDVAGNRLLWCDIPGGTVHETLAGEDGWRAGRSWEMGGPVGAVMPAAAGGFIAAVGHRIVHVDADGEHRVVCTAGFDPQQLRFNDGKCDPAGRFWVGTQSHDGSAGKGAALYCLDVDGRLHERLGGVTISNGLDWSPDGRFFYYIDTPTLGIDRFDFDVERGLLANRHSLITHRKGEGRPDGMAVDAEGGLWVAFFYAGVVRHYAPDGRLIEEIATGVPQTTSCAFGGPAGTTLFVTTARARVPEWRALDAGFPLSIIEEALNAAHAGDLLAFEPGVSGPPAQPWG